MFLQVRISWNFEQMFETLFRLTLPIFEWNYFLFVNLQIFFQKEWFRVVLRVFLVVEAQNCATANFYFSFSIFCYNIHIVKINKISKFEMKQSKRWIVMAKIVKSTISSQSLWKSAFSPQFLMMKRSELYSFGIKHHKKRQLW